jgi:uncharacterized phiE125 gp8 family phage protein
MLTLERVLPPALEPVGLAEAKAHLRLDTDDEDALVSALIASARHVVEAFTERALIEQEWRLLLDRWPGTPFSLRDGLGRASASTRLFLEVPRPPLISVEHVKLFDQDGEETLWEATNYFVDTVSAPGRLVRRRGVSWPLLRRDINGVEIKFRAGYGAAEDVPQPIRQAILMLVAHWYENREPVPPRTIGAVLPLSVEMMLEPYRLRRL